MGFRIILSLLLLAGGGKILFAFDTSATDSHMTSQGGITGSGGFAMQMSVPRAALRAKQARESKQKPQAQEPTSRDLADLALDERAPELRDALIDSKDSITAPDADRDAIRAKLGQYLRPPVNPDNLSRKKITRHRPTGGKTEAATRDQARKTAELFKKEVNASKVNNLGDQFYQTSMEGLWDNADELYNLAVKWINE